MSLISGKSRYDNVQCFDMPTALKSLPVVDLARLEYIFALYGKLSSQHADSVLYTLC